MRDQKAHKISVLFASSLKPVLDSRSFGRLGLSLRETNKYQLNFIGFSSKSLPKSTEDRFFVSINDYHSRWQRLIYPIKLGYLLLKIEPKVLICCSWETLPVAKILKPWIKFKLIYDVQENYVKNLELNPDLSKRIRAIATWIIQKAENPRGIDFHLLAEACYAGEMPKKRPYIILENKFPGPSNPLVVKSYKSKKSFRFLITGTLTPKYGVLNGIRFFKSILADYPNSQLLVTGHVPLKSFEKKLQEIGEKYPEIHLKLSTSPIPHQDILEALKQADFLLLPYELDPAILNKLPSKLFEACGLGCPIIINSNSRWDHLVTRYKLGISIHFDEPIKSQEEFREGLNTSFFENLESNFYSWNKEGKLLIQVLEELLGS